MVATAWDVRLGHEFGEPFTIHGVGLCLGNSMAGYGIVDGSRIALADHLAQRKTAIVEAMYDRAGFASAPYVDVKQDNLASRFVDRIIEGLREDDFVPLLDWVRDLHQISDRRLLAEVDIPRMLDAGCALVINAAASIRDEITDIALFFAELRQQLQGAYVRSTIRAAERSRISPSKTEQARKRATRPDHLAAEIARELGLDEQACSFMEYVAGVLSAGERLVPAELLGRDTPLSKPEIELISEHTAVGTQTLSRVEALRALAAIELHREAAWDGADGTPLASRIIAVVDAYEAMMARQLSREQALQMLEAEAGERLDPRVVAAATRLLKG